MNAVFRALQAKQTGVWPPEAAAAESRRRRWWVRYSWILLVGALMLAAALTLTNIETPANAASAPANAASAPANAASAPAAPAERTLGVADAGEPDEFLAYADPIGMQAEMPWGEMALDLAIKLGLVVALIMAVLWLIRFVRRRGATSPKVPEPTGFAEILDTAELGPGQQVYLLDVGDRVLVLGATAQHVTSLSEITDRDEIEALRRRTGLRRQKSFSGWLTRAVERASPVVGSGVADNGESIARAGERRRTLRQSAARLRELAKSHHRVNRPQI